MEPDYQVACNFSKNVGGGLEGEKHKGDMDVKVSVHGRKEPVGGVCVFWEKK